MKYLLSKRNNKVAVACAFLLLLVGSTACDPNEILYPPCLNFTRVVTTNEKGIYMVRFNKKGINVYFEHRTESTNVEVLSEFQDYPPEEFIRHSLEMKVPYGSGVDSVGIYDKVTDGLLAMFYSRVHEAKGKVSSTDYTNPYLRENWDVYFDQKKYNERKWEAVVGTVTFTLKKLEKPAKEEPLP